MKPLIIIAATAFAIVVLLPLLAAASLLFPLLPYVVVGVLLSAVLQRRHRAAASRSVPAASPYRTQPLPQSAVGGWVYVPVWVAPPARPAPIVVEGQVVERRDG